MIPAAGPLRLTGSCRGSPSEANVRAVSKIGSYAWAGLRGESAQCGLLCLEFIKVRVRHGGSLVQSAESRPLSAAPVTARPHRLRCY